MAHRAAYAVRVVSRLPARRSLYIPRNKRQQLQIFRGLTGVEGVGEEEGRNTIFDWLRKEHYRGVEASLSTLSGVGPGAPMKGAADEGAERERWRLSLRRHNLDLIATLTTQGNDTVEQHLESLERQAAEAKEVEAVSLSIQGGCQAWDMDQQVKFAGGVAEVAAKLNIPCVLETHKNRVLSTPLQTKELMSACEAGRIPLKINADLSQWCDKGQSLFSTSMDPELVEGILTQLASHVHSVHARTGCGEDGKAPDPRKKEYSLEKSTHERWWDLLLDGMLTRGVPPRIKPEFGPELSANAEGVSPKDDLWEINSFLADMHRARWASRYGCCGCCGSLCFYREKGQKGF
mmetsp:Transcript_38884/g.76010  ORF Transcript_38884/g.76010 Transcript_38884/m.76010 type:complete len:348 (-) Transcript_38884:28-1071(-)